MTHIIQKRDLLEMLKPFEDSDQIVCIDDNGREQTIDNASRFSCVSRRVGIQVSGNERVSELEGEIEEIEKHRDAAIELLRKFDLIMLEGCLGDKLDSLHADIEKFIA